ncbi:unnamed protein product [Ostreobium quekettii]|uniref:DNA-directed primase/polymerase protein n=1 Tax=Ostreobium quekettii TaxID=121088 RepID=A0A8S1JGL0_9CHLO|nr:unnamed protein product [Ostreobium quekettii]|eukprot:evm.model.scf_1685.3 EVM.evm.TU.scf_1685.3   scf_1685:13164-18140(-)
MGPRVDSGSDLRIDLCTTDEEDCSRGCSKAEDLPRERRESGNGERPRAPDTASVRGWHEGCLALGTTAVHRDFGRQAAAMDFADACNSAKADELMETARLWRPERQLVRRWLGPQTATSGGERLPGAPSASGSSETMAEEGSGGAGASKRARSTDDAGAGVKRRRTSAEEWREALARCNEELRKGAFAAPGRRGNIRNGRAGGSDPGVGNLGARSTTHGRSSGCLLGSVGEVPSELGGAGNPENGNGNAGRRAGAPVGRFGGHRPCCSEAGGADCAVVVTRGAGTCSDAGAGAVREEGADRAGAGDDACEFRNEAVRLFGEEVEYENGSGRSFIGATYMGMWKRYRGTSMHQRHFYEIVRDRRPCHLYFDVDLQKGKMKEEEGDAMVDRLLSYVDAELRDTWDLHLRDALVLELDSTTSIKFSRHLIVRLAGAAFEDNQAAGAFVKRVVNKYRDEDPALFAAVDVSVYSRNRQFRMLWSSKAENQVALMPTCRFSLSQSFPNHERLFLLCLVCNVDPNARLLKLKGATAVQMVSRHCSGGPQDISELATFQCQQDTTDTSRNGDNTRNIMISWKREHYGSGGPPDSLRGQALKAVPFIERLGRSRSCGLSVEVRKLRFQGGEMVAFNCLGPGSHACALKGGLHRSNHIYFVVDFETNMLCQKCFDPECSVLYPEWTPFCL